MVFNLKKKKQNNQTKNSYRLYSRATKRERQTWSRARLVEKRDHGYENHEAVSL